MARINHPGHLPLKAVVMIASLPMIREAPFLFDTHVHLDAPVLRKALEQELTLARLGGVRRYLIPGVAREGWSQILSLARSVPGAWAAPGLHPQAAAQWTREAEEELATLLADPVVVAVGEIGLDAMLTDVAAELQERAFRDQVRLAVAAGRPILIHCRRATGNLLRILKQEGASAVGGIMHGFSGSLETAQEAIKMGFAIGFGGAVTFPEARRAPGVLKRISPEWIVLETDAPDLAPHPHRGEENHPAYLPLVAARVAEIREWSEEKVARITSENAARILKIQKRSDQ